MLSQVSYTSENVVEGKRAAKRALQERLGLRREDLPLVGIITRLTHQKGIHLIKHAIGRALERGGQVGFYHTFLHCKWVNPIMLQFLFFTKHKWNLWWQVVLLGSAPDPRIQNDFVNLANHWHSSKNDRARLCLTYDEPLSHLVVFRIHSFCHLLLLFLVVHSPLTFAGRSFQLTPMNFLSDICWCRFHFGPLYFWAMWTDPTHCYEIWFHCCCSKNWRCVHIRSFCSG